MVRHDSKLSKTSNKKCPVVLHGDLRLFTLYRVNEQRYGIFAWNKVCTILSLKMTAVRGTSIGGCD